MQRQGKGQRALRFGVKASILTTNARARDHAKALPDNLQSVRRLLKEHAQWIVNRLRLTQRNDNAIS
jgi:hypothetical protein